MKSSQSNFHAARACIIVCLSLASVGCVLATDNSPQWEKHTLQDGGSIELPKTFSTARVTFEVMKTYKGKEPAYRERLLSAKGVHDTVVCSLKIWRVWAEDADGNVIQKETPNAYLMKLFDSSVKITSSMMKTQRLEPSSFRKVGDRVYYSCSYLGNNGGSRFDQFAFYRKGFVYFINAAYRKVGEDYWTDTIIETVATFAPGDLYNKDSAVSEGIYETESKWTKYDLDGNSRLWLPSDWLCIYRNSKPELNGSADEGFVVGFQTLMNARPHLHEGDTSTLHICRMFARNTTTGKLENFAEDEKKEFEAMMVQGLLEGLSDHNVSIASGPKHITVADLEMVTREYKIGMGSQARTTQIYIFEKEDCLYFIMHGFLEKDAKAWQRAMTEVLEKWEFGVTREDTDEVQIGEVDTDDSEDDVFVYRNNEYHFSLILPKSWTRISQSVLDDFSGLAGGLSGTQVNYIAGFQKGDLTKGHVPHFLVQYVDTKGAPVDMLEEYFESEKTTGELSEAANTVEQNSGGLVSDCGVTILDVDTENHVVTSRSKTKVAGEGYYYGYSLGFIGRRSMVNIHFYSRSRDFTASELKEIKNITSTFSYDMGYDADGQESLR
ncbi:hypothetical protein STSP2_03283 [Anaerohalosphaera lusitana]|uniref:Uncharacterized protein n=1 Tax=Anaerohalosphaera lusitana TaxID=1936003 RepID=A0A1U9NQ68_9BACT|nr:hypothetical protein [Anaerohalosphaera lusitana]AQT70081.1 hypothetical protein STSP2_03283 [Anaerohalosphaera lusitana]